jgi:phosphatidylglycerophosphatase A
MISIRRLPPTLHGTEPFYLLSTWFYAGRIKPVSGSWGSLAALPLCWLLKYLGGDVTLIVFGIAVFFAGMWAIKEYMPHTKNVDPAEVVIDEVVGMAITFLAIPVANLWLIAIGFVAFRLFDGIKRGPVGWCDRNVKGPLGVMVDDVVAGALTVILLLILRRAFF